MELNSEKIFEDAIEKSKELLKTKPMIAEVVLRQFLKCSPNNPQGLQLLGLALHRMNKHAESIEVIQKAIEIDPNSADNHNNISLAYASLHKYEKAIKHLEKAIELNPNQNLYYNNLALQYRNIEDYDKSIATFKKSLELENLAQVWGNLGGVYGEVKDLNKAEECFLKALKISPDYPAAHVDLAFVRHLSGDYTEGFKEYEWRFDYFTNLQFYKKAYDQNKKWDGKSDLNRKTILLYGEQGMGDTIQFVRYVPKLKEMGANTIIHCPTPLNNVIGRCAGVDAIINRDIVTGQGDDFPNYDYQCSLISLPYLLGEWETSNEPYIKPIATLNVKENYPDTFNIGISWAGSPAHPNDALRSLKLKYFRPIHDMSKIKLFNLQIDMRKRMQKTGLTNVDLTEGADDMSIVDMTDMIQTFDDSATIVSGLDLVITCDTALLHLCGAMGVPCWGLIQYNPDWRWKLTGNTTVWYDSVKLFRQEERHNWEDVIQKVKKELNESTL